MPNPLYPPTFGANGAEPVSLAPPAKPGALSAAVWPGAMVSSVLGFAAGRAAGKQKATLEAERQNRQQNLALGGDFYQSVDHLIKNLVVDFTPFGVLYRVGNVTLETIETDEMSPSMYKAWQNHNSAFYQQLMYNKIQLETAMASQMFAQQLLTQHNQLTQGPLEGGETPEKKGESVEEWEGPERLARWVGELEHLAAAPTTLPWVLALERRLAPLEVDWTLASWRPFTDDWVEHWAAEPAPAYVYYPKDHTPWDNATYLKNRVRIAFLPDRVVFIVNNAVVAQLSLLHMSLEGYQAFRAQDVHYFRKIFTQKVKAGEQLQKEAALAEMRWEPSVVLSLLRFFFGDRWEAWDPGVLLKNWEEAGAPPLAPAMIPILWVWQALLSPRFLWDPYVVEKSLMTLASLDDPDPAHTVLWTARQGVPIRWLWYGLALRQAARPEEFLLASLSEGVGDWITAQCERAGWRWVEVPELSQGENAPFWPWLNGALAPTEEGQAAQAVAAASFPEISARRVPVELVGPVLQAVWPARIPLEFQGVVTTMVTNNLELEDFFAMHAARGLLEWEALQGKKED